jgi:hypothetical protein
MEVKQMTEEEKVKSPEEYAEIEMNKKIGKSIAKRKQQIKKLEEEIKKLKSGEMTPDEDDDKSSHHNQKEEEIKEIVRERIIEREKPSYYPYWDEPKPFKPYSPFIKPMWISKMRCQ